MPPFITDMTHEVFRLWRRLYWLPEWAVVAVIVAGFVFVGWAANQIVFALLKLAVRNSGEKTVPTLSALNLDLRDEYVADCANGVRRWNQELEEAGLDERLYLPHEGFSLRVGVYAQHHVSPTGEVLSDEAWAAAVDGWLPNDEDRAAVAALMVPEYGLGRFAGWIAPPQTGINDQPVEFDYVHLAEEGVA